ncbi:MAG TPA: sulfatase-like hydrolase/transferase, partial [Pirellulales bacterium]|nr:sulfatase-like hydrolase/transferase [Pirellulales bacterium]
MKRLIVLAALICCALVPSKARAAEKPKRPNFLFIYTDDQRWDAMGVVQREHGEHARFPWFKTPNMDRLASEGVRFRNAFVTMSLCAPSRAAFLTGRYNHCNGVSNNGTPFPEDNVTYASLLGDAGYVTGYFGKWHMDGQEDRPGFDTWASFVGQGKYFNCPVIVDDDEVLTTGWVDDVTTDYALEFLDENQAESFAMVVGYKSAHGPFDPPERAAERFAGKEARKTPNFDTPAIYKAEGVAEAKRETNLGYFRCLSAIDENLGRLLDALDHLK